MHHKHAGVIQEYPRTTQSLWILEHLVGSPIEADGVDEEVVNLVVERQMVDADVDADAIWAIVDAIYVAKQDILSVNVRIVVVMQTWKAVRSQKTGIRARAETS